MAADGDSTGSQLQTEKVRSAEILFGKWSRAGVLSTIGICEQISLKITYFREMVTKAEPLIR